MNDLSLADRTAHRNNGNKTLTIAYGDTLPAGGAEQNVVLLHGYCGSSAYWEQLLPLISKPGRRIITPDARGHGRSSSPDEGVYTMDEMADDVIALMDELGIERFIVLGHSMGGYVSLSLAERYAARLLGFGLVHSTAYPDSDAARANRDRAVAKIAEEGIGKFVEGLVPNLFAPDADAKLLEHSIQIGRQTNAAGAQASALGMKERPDRLNVIESSSLPVLLLSGKKDGVIPSERTFTSSRNGVSQVLLEQAGHMGMMEAPQSMADAVNRYLDAITG
ncbi:alpha/beta fold hydrolase [Paenibacillus xylaniclasticus]|uniref:alpha/beta fold hydrolase n=1 Tax=Paenibacillus xylaniclasticus TaxID=588083 RepID=UPI000FD8FC2E|nr:MULTISPECIES: alpha/beta hydrolase [Paenibacillus]GFN33067.1 alpha/beta hydrolase [Paenibacillus curdlanolyticus]